MLLFATLDCFASVFWCHVEYKIVLYYILVSGNLVVTVEPFTLWT